MLIVLTTVAKKTDAERLAKLLVKNKLSPCVNIIKIEKSIYHWKGKIKQSGEYLLIIKTRMQNYKKLEQSIKKHHSYKLPEIIAVETSHGSFDYLKWIRNSC